MLNVNYSEYKYIFRHIIQNTLSKYISSYFQNDTTAQATIILNKLNLLLNIIVLKIKYGAFK